MHSLSDVDEPATKANIYGTVIMISPVKKGKYSEHPFFEGDFVDQTSKLQLVGFESFQQRILVDYHNKQVPVEVTMEG